MSRPFARVALAFLLCSSVAAAQPGTLDSSFGAAGTVFLTPAPTAGASAVVNVDGDKLVLAGLVGGDAALLRLDADGGLDTSFGTQGYALLDLGGDEDRFAGLVVRSGGTLVAVGLGENGAGDGVNVLAGFTADGVLDPSFGNEGTVSLSEGFESLQFTQLTKRSGGQLVVVGSGIPDGASESVAVVAQFSAEGELDLSFGTNGIGRVALSGRGLAAVALDVQADGSIVIGGLAEGSGFFDADPFAARFLADGSTDSAFGIRTFDFGASFSAVSGVLIDTSDRAVLIGSANDLVAQSASLILARLNSDGTLDPTFGDGGLVSTTLGAGLAQGTALTQQADGKLLATGVAGPNAASADLAVARFTSEGTLDTGFGEGGAATADIAAVDIGAALVLQPDGKIVVAGYENSLDSEPLGIEVARFENDGLPIATEPASLPTPLLLGAPYPNPTSGTAWLPITSVPGRALHVELFDRLGRQVALLHDGMLTTPLLRLDLGSLAPGAYAVRARSGRNVTTQWLIVN